MRHGRWWAVALGLAVAAAVAAVQAQGMEEIRDLLQAGKVVEARAAALDLARDGNVAARETLASMLLRGIGGPADRAGAMGWLCLRAHAPQGGRGATEAVWLLAEYFRTGGGLPGWRYNDGDRARENPVKAYFWFQVLARQEQFFREVERDAVRLGRLGAETVAKQLVDAERQRVDRRLEHWNPGAAPAFPERCLALPDP